MNWTLAIEQNREPLLRIVATLFTLLGLGGKDEVTRVSWARYRAVLSILRPAESAVRRLIMVSAHWLKVDPVIKRAAAERKSTAKPAKNRASNGRVSFRLFDPRMRFSQRVYKKRSGAQPRVIALDVSFDPRVPFLRQPNPVPPLPQPDETVNAVPLSRRLVAIKSALEDLPRQARRYARWSSKPVQDRKPRFFSAIRPGAPPGAKPKHIKQPRHEVEEILKECHWLANNLPTLNTS